MNKYVIIIIVLAVLVGGGIAYKKFAVPEADLPQDSGVVREITLTINKNSWSWDPEIIEAEQGETVKLTVVNKDEYEHGITIEAFGVSQRIGSNQTVAIKPFVVTQAGEFPFYCSVPCGDGVVNGKPRGHLDQTGRLKVRAVVKAQPIEN